MAARQDTCGYCQRTGPGRHLHNFVNDEMSYLHLDQGRWAGRQAQIGLAVIHYKRHCEIHVQDAREGQRTHCLRISPINCEEVWRADSCTYNSVRMKLQWIIVSARTGPMISETNKKCLDFATQCISDKDSFDDVICTDESSIQLV